MEKKLILPFQTSEVFQYKHAAGKFSCICKLVSIQSLHFKGKENKNL